MLNIFQRCYKFLRHSPPFLCKHWRIPFAKNCEAFERVIADSAFPVQYSNFVAVFLHSSIHIHIHTHLLSWLCACYVQVLCGFSGFFHPCTTRLAHIKLLSTLSAVKWSLMHKTPRRTKEKNELQLGWIWFVCHCCCSLNTSEFPLFGIKYRCRIWIKSRWR